MAQGRSNVVSIAVLLIVVCGNTFAGSYSGGTGEPNDPYLIATAEDLNDIGNQEEDWDKHFLLIADIDLADYTGTDFNIIGSFYPGPSSPFRGTFDGNGHRILNFNYQTPEGYKIGLFAALTTNEGQVQIKNLTFVDPNIDAGEGGDSGVLFGICIRNTYISNCRVINGLVKGRGGVAGLGGMIMYGDVSECYSSADIVAVTLGTYPAPAGGLIAANNYGTISRCRSTGNVVSDGKIVGGLVGFNLGNIIKCYSSANVVGEDYVGGFLGYNTGSASECYSVGSVFGTGVYIGGFVGVNSEIVNSCFWDIETSGLPEPWAGTGLTTAEMKTVSTFTDAGWDFVDTWNIGENQTYPFLRTHPAGDVNHDDIVNFLDLAILADHWLLTTP